MWYAFPFNHGIDLFWICVSLNYRISYLKYEWCDYSKVHAICASLFHGMIFFCIFRLLAMDFQAISNGFFFSLCIFRPLAMELAQPSLFDYLPRRLCPPGKIRTNFVFFWSIFLFSLKQIIFIFHEGWCFSWVRTVEHIVGIATPKSGVWPHYKLDYLSRLHLKETTLQKEFCSLKKTSQELRMLSLSLFIQG